MWPVRCCSAALCLYAGARAIIRQRGGLVAKHGTRLLLPPLTSCTLPAWLPPVPSNCYPAMLEWGLYGKNVNMGHPALADPGLECNVRRTVVTSLASFRAAALAMPARKSASLLALIRHRATHHRRDEKPPGPNQKEKRGKPKNQKPNTQTPPKAGPSKGFTGNIAPRDLGKFSGCNWLRLVRTVTRAGRRTRAVRLQ